MEYIEVKFNIDPFSEERAEIVIAVIEDLGYDGFVIESPYLKAYIPKDSYSASNLKTILAAYQNFGANISFSCDLIPDKNWNALWESNFEPIVIGGKCTIRASFHKGLPRTKYVIVIDPKMAFGTGHHNTTHLMVEYLLEYEGRLNGRQVLDMGCGTGLLSILAAKIGACLPVHAIDIDPVAVRSTKENISRNRVSQKISVLCGDASLLQSGKYDLILANINRNILMEDISTYSRSMPPNGELIISGFYREDSQMLIDESSRNSLCFVSEKYRENWAALKFVKVLRD